MPKPKANKDKAAFAAYTTDGYGEAGLTKREYAAIHIAAALTGNSSSDCDGLNSAAIADVASEIADKLLDQLSK